MMALKEIAIKTGLTLASVYGICRRHNLCVEHNGKKYASIDLVMKNAGEPRCLLSVRQLSVMLGCTEMTVHKYMSKYPCCCFDFQGIRMGYISHIRAIYSRVRAGRKASSKNSQKIDSNRVRRALKIKNYKVGDFLRQAKMKERRYYQIINGEENPTKEEKEWFNALVKGVK